MEKFIYLIIVFLPVYLIRINIFGAPTNLLEILIAMLFLLTIIQKKYRAELKRVGMKYQKFWLPIGMIFFGLVASMFVNNSWRIPSGILKGWFVFPLIFVWVVASFLKKEKIKNVYGALFFSGLATALISMIYFIFDKLTFDGRLQAFFNSPNYLAMYLAPAIIFGAVKFQEKKKKLILAYLAIIIFVFYQTFSYASWLAVLLTLVVVFFLNKKINKKYLIIPSLIFFAFLILQFKSQKFQSAINFSEQSSIQSRIMIWSSAEKILADNWFWGIGAGNFQEKYLQYQEYFPPYLQWAVPHPHNLFLAFWLSSGLIGLLGFLLLLILFFQKLIRQENNNLKFIIFGIMLYFLLHGMVDTTYFKNDLAVVFWLLFLF